MSCWRSPCNGERRTAATDWWASYFDAQYLREYEPIFSADQDRRDVARLVELLRQPVGARVLDVPCGQGRHAHLLAEAGYRVEGLDYSAHLLSVARARANGVRYTRGDMRRMPGRWTGRFDAVVNLFTLFGFFLDPRDDARVLREVARVLRPGGVFVWHGASRDGVVARMVSRDWWHSDNGTLIAHRRAFDPLSGILTVRVMWRGHTGIGLEPEGEREYRIRLYTPTRLAELCADAGMIVEEAYDGWTDRALRRRTTTMVLVARSAAR